MSSKLHDILKYKASIQTGPGNTRGSEWCKPSAYLVNNPQYLIVYYQMYNDNLDNDKQTSSITRKLNYIAIKCIYNYFISKISEVINNNIDKALADKALADKGLTISRKTYFDTCLYTFLWQKVYLLYTKSIELYGINNINNNIKNDKKCLQFPANDKINFLCNSGNTCYLDSAIMCLFAFNITFTECNLLCFPTELKSDNILVYKVIENCISIKNIIYDSTKVYKSIGKIAPMEQFYKHIINAGGVVYDTTIYRMGDPFVDVIYKLVEFLNIQTLNITVEYILNDIDRVHVTCKFGNGIWIIKQNYPYSQCLPDNDYSIYTLYNNRFYIRYTGASHGNVNADSLDSVIMIDIFKHTLYSMFDSIYKTIGTKITSKGKNITGKSTGDIITHDDIIKILNSIIVFNMLYFYKTSALSLKLYRNDVRQPKIILDKNSLTVGYVSEYFTAIMKYDTISKFGEFDTFNIWINNHITILNQEIAEVNTNRFSKNMPGLNVNELLYELFEDFIITFKTIGYDHIMTELYGYNFYHIEYNPDTMNKLVQQLKNESKTTPPSNSVFALCLYEQQRFTHTFIKNTKNTKNKFVVFYKDNPYNMGNINHTIYKTTVELFITIDKEKLYLYAIIVRTRNHYVVYFRYGDMTDSKTPWYLYNDLRTEYVKYNSNPLDDINIRNNTIVSCYDGDPIKIFRQVMQ